MDLLHLAAPLNARRVQFATMDTGPCDRVLAPEVPIAFEFNGLAYAVMMASPSDLPDFATGFALSEGLVRDADEIIDIAPARVERGVIVRVVLEDARAAPLRDRLRLRLVEGSCGLCGLESIDEVLRPLPALSGHPRFDKPALARAVQGLRAHQPMQEATGAMHAAAFCLDDGTIAAVREDVGRHNALDKLIGCLAREGRDPADGFFLLSSRCSYELVEKTVRAGCPALVTISAPSDLAVSRAKEAGLTLVALARSDSALVLNDPLGILE